MLWCAAVCRRAARRRGRASSSSWRRSWGWKKPSWCCWRSSARARCRETPCRRSTHCRQCRRPPPSPPASCLLSDTSLLCPCSPPACLAPRLRLLSFEERPQAIKAPSRLMLHSNTQWTHVSNLGKVSGQLWYLLKKIIQIEHWNFSCLPKQTVSSWIWDKQSWTIHYFKINYIFQTWKSKFPIKKKWNY